MASERKYTISKLDWAKLNSKWAAQRPNAAEEAAKISQQRRNLWDALNEFIRKDGGAIVSVKYTSPIRIEAATDSELPARLPGIEYDIAMEAKASATANLLVGAGASASIDPLFTIDPTFAFANDFTLVFSDGIDNGPTNTPVPAALPLFVTGLGGLGLLGWRRKRKAQA
jgi:hypothetical protein